MPSPRSANSLADFRSAPSWEIINTCGDFDWDDLRDLVRRTEVIDRERIYADCARGFRFLAELTPEELTLASDPHQREQVLAERLRGEL